MSASRVLLAPEIPGLAALGASSAAALLGLSEKLKEEGRAVLLGRDAHSVRWRIPLPGTPAEDDQRGGLTGVPGGAGTGFVHVRRFQRAPLGLLLRARFSAPRSDSLAAREWNLLCHLRAHGVSTPEPLAVASLESGFFARCSVLVTRELEGLTSMPRWLAEVAAPAARLSAARVLGRLLARVHASRVVLPDWGWERLSLSLPTRAQAESGCHEHAAESGDACTKPTSCASEAMPGRAPQLRRRGSLQAALLDCGGGRIVQHVYSKHMLELLSNLLRARPAPLQLSAREALALFLVATRSPSLRRERRHLLRSLAHLQASLT